MPIPSAFWPYTSASETSTLLQSIGRLSWLSMIGRIWSRLNICCSPACTSILTANSTSTGQRISSAPSLRISPMMSASGKVLYFSMLLNVITLRPRSNGLSEMRSFSRSHTEQTNRALRRPAICAMSSLCRFTASSIDVRNSSGLRLSASTSFCVSRSASSGVEVWSTFCG